MLGATARIVAAAAGERTARFVAPTNQTAAAGVARRLGRGKAALGLKGVAAVRNGGARGIGSVSPDHWARGEVVDEVEGGGAAWGHGGGGAAEMASSTTAVCCSFVLRKCERLIRMPSCHTSIGFFLGC